MSLTLTINGRQLAAEKGQTVLQAARQHDIYIPTLCDYPGLPSHGSCRMCIVEIKGRASTPTACTTMVEEGMLVETDTPQIREIRSELLRMLLADHPGGCLFCPENQHCEECMVTLHKAGVTTGCRACPADRQCGLQEMVARSGLKNVAYPVRYRGLRVEKEDPFFDRDYNLCVLCGRCIRVCESLHFSNIPTYIQRGSETRVGTSFDQSHLSAGCSFCGACVDACPTGTLWEKTRKWDGKPEGAVVSTCTFCSLGCEISLLTKTEGAEIIIGSQPLEMGKTLCVKGRFGVTEWVNHPNRLKEVLRIEQGHTVRSGWQEAVQLTAQRLAQTKPEEFAMLVSASCSNEEMYIANKFSRTVMGSPVTLSSAARYGHGLETVSRLMQASLPLEALDSADLIFCLGVDVKYFQSVAERHLKQAGERGVKLISLNANPHVPGRFADLWLKPLPGEEEDMLNDLINGQMEGMVGQAADLLSTAEKPVLLVGPDFLAKIPEKIERLHAISRAGLVLLAAEGNLGGAFRLGLGSASASLKPQVLYLIGSSLPSGLDSDTFILYQNTHMPQAAFQEGLLLPMAGFGETQGSIIDQGGKTKLLNAAVAPVGNALPGWEILCRIAREMNKPGFDFASVVDITREMNESLPNKTCAVELPVWLEKTDEHDFMGANLSQWVDGLNQILQAQGKES